MFAGDTRPYTPPKQLAASAPANRLPEPDHFGGSGGAWPGGAAPGAGSSIVSSWPPGAPAGAAPPTRGDGLLDLFNT